MVFFSLLPYTTIFDAIAGSRKSALWQLLPHGKAHPARRASRKGALWPRLRGAPHQKTHSGGFGARRMCLSVTSNSRMRFSVECAFPHLRKRGVSSRKSALCALGLTEKRSLRAGPHGKAQSGPRPQSTPHGKAHSAYDRALDVTEWHSRALQARRQAPRPSPRPSVTYLRPAPPATRPPVTHLRHARPPVLPRPRRPAPPACATM